MTRTLVGASLKTTTTRNRDSETVEEAPREYCWTDLVGDVDERHFLCLSCTLCHRLASRDCCLAGGGEDMFRAAREDTEGTGACGSGQQRRPKSAIAGARANASCIMACGRVGSVGARTSESLVQAQQFRGTRSVVNVVYVFVNSIVWCVLHELHNFCEYAAGLVLSRAGSASARLNTRPSKQEEVGMWVQYCTRTTG